MNAGSKMPLLLTPYEAATYLKISRATLYRLIEKRCILFYKVGGSIRLDQDDLLDYLNSRRAEPVVNDKL